MGNERTDGAVTVRLSGRIDSGNAPRMEREILEQLRGKDSGTAVILDAEALEYTSSAGLRVILRLKRDWPDMKIVGVNPEVYEILDMTGFTEMMPVEKAYRLVSVEGCEVIGRGANGTIYRIDQDNVVKAYTSSYTLDDIRHEREVAKLALILGIPTAISYDVVKVGESYGSVFELLSARTFSEILAAEPEKMDWCVQEYVAMLKRIHSTLVPAGKLPDMKETILSYTRYLEDYLPADAYRKLVAMVEAVPHDDHMIHGDYHTKNIVLQNGEVLVIDMDTLSVGHPIFELPGIYNAYIGFSELHHEVVKDFQGFDFETSSAFWRKFLAAYLETDSESRLREVEDKVRILAYTRLIRRTVFRGEQDTAEGREGLAYRTERLLELLERTDTLLFRPEDPAT